jgi:hypothetical protein
MLNGLKTLLSANSGASTKRFCYLLVVVAAIAWVSVDLRHGISDKWLDAYHALLILVGSGYLGGKAINILPGAAPKKPGDE